MSKTLGMLHQLVEYIFNLIGVKRIYQIKLTHALSHELLRLTCDQIATLVTDSQLDEAHVHDSILDAAKNGIPEFITGVINANPIAQYAKDSLGMWLFFSAVRFRQAKVFSLIYGLVAKTRFLYEKDDNRNSLLHTAGMLESSSQLNRISGAALQMQRELQWFEEVKHITPPGFWEHRNKEGL
ncbi:hypothetical protein L6164_037548 [Bauhinia variegata]|uniref:Uncharacterized protein n=1 Tax=Bauhinia variegata TaxID=167791 RepID=A0ACB9KKC3_BAUVA|nr:hypothetical protein L6164_037548 [Bauhinia variegata]